MSQLLRQLRKSGVVDELALQSAMRRQQIYGGSLDTVLLELELLDPVTLDAELALANQCGSVPVGVLEPGPERPWELVPRELTDLGWAMPLRRHLGRIQVAIHPEIPDERRALLERTVQHVEVLVTCEAGLAKLAAERTGSVMPQRYAVLALTWMQGLRRAQPVEREPDAPRVERPLAAPWMTAPGTAPYTVPPPEALPARKPISQPKPKSPEDEGKGRNPTFLYGLPLDDDEAPASEQPPTPAASPLEPTPLEPTPIEPPPSEPARSEPSASASLSQLPIDDDDYVDPLAGIDDDDAVPKPRMVATRGAEVRPAAQSEPAASVGTPVAAASERDRLHERLAGPRSALEEAVGRDQATDALTRAAMVLSPRVALFGIKREGLRGIPSPGQIPDVENQLIEASPAVQAAIEGREVLDMTTDLDLRLAVGQELAVPCLFLPVKVHDQPVLMLYVDRSGEPFSVDEIDAAYELCEIAGRTLEGVLMRLKSGAASSPAKPAVSTTPTTPTPDTPSATPAVSPVGGGSIAPAMPTFAPPGASKPTSGPVFAPPPRTPSGPTFTPPSARTSGPSPVVPPVAPPAPTPPVASPSVVSPIVEPPGLPEIGKPPVRLKRVPSGATSTPIVATPPASASPSLGTPPSASTFTPPPSHEPPPSPTEAASEPGPAESVVQTEAPPTRAGLTALATPLGSNGPSGPTSTSPSPEESGSIRGRIELDDEDHPRPTSAATQELDSAITAALRGGASAIEHLRQLGEPALRRIAKLFPGELDVHRRDLDTLPPLPAHGALIRVCLELGPELGPHLLEVIDHPNPNVRFYAAFIFQELRDHRAIPALGELAFDPDADVRAIAMRVLETYSGEPGFDAAAGQIRRELDSPNRTRQLHSTRAVGTLRDIQAVSKLIDLLSSKERYIQEAALESLCSITGQQLGLKPHRWRSWYGDNAHHHRVEWIISSLAHKDLSVRRWAADELRRITGQRIMFPATGTKQEREIGLQKWVDWWTNEGRAKFGG